MKHLLAFAATVLITLFYSCQKENRVEDIDDGTDIFQVRLKDVIVGTLPSPLYHFNYTAEGRISAISLQDETRNYIVQYSGLGIEKIQRTDANRMDRLDYEYSNGKVIGIKVYNSAGEQIKRCFISYNAIGKIEQMEWELKVAAGFHSWRTREFEYYADSNLAVMRDQRFEVPGVQQAAEHIETYADYDRKYNPAGFIPTHDFEEDPTIIPGFFPQKNNARLVTRRGTGVHYDLKNDFSYNGAGLPVRSLAEVKFLTGPGAGQTLQLITTYSYY